MNYPQDFQLTYFKINQKKDSIDSYALIKSITNQIVANNIEFSIDNSMPVILGDLKLIKEHIIDCIEKAINLFQNHVGTLYIEYRKFQHSNILIYFTKDAVKSEVKNSSSNIIDVISEFNIGICKYVNNKNEDIIILQPIVNQPI